MPAGCGMLGVPHMAEEVLGKPVPPVSCDLRCQEVQLVKVNCGSLGPEAFLEIMRKITGKAPGKIHTSTEQ